jgi:hypothetical protein
MNRLTEEQWRLCQQYINMVFVIEEGFKYVKDSFTDFTKTEGDRVLVDIYQSLLTITQTNIVLEQLFIDNEEIQQSIKEFTKVIDVAIQLDGHFDDYNKKVNVVNEYLYPSFIVWKESIQIAMKSYVTQ